MKQWLMVSTSTKLLIGFQIKLEFTGHENKSAPNLVPDPCVWRSGGRRLGGPRWSGSRRGRTATGSSLCSWPANQIIRCWHEPPIGIISHSVHFSAIFFTSGWNLHENGILKAVWPWWSGTRFCWLRFGMFHHPAWVVGSYSSGPKSPQIQVNKTLCQTNLGHAVLMWQKRHASLELCAEKRRVGGDEGVWPPEHEEVGKAGRGHSEVRCAAVIEHLAFDQRLQDLKSRMKHAECNSSMWQIIFQFLYLESLLTEVRSVEPRHPETAYALLDVEPRAIHWESERWYLKPEGNGPI